ncbi:MAG: DNA-3-methyladenine glycosylase [Gemmatimonadaceae bacterium]|nr:DNA-3-methyladenine glycosylase [Gemmatimonadaceae bacterium]
MHRVRRSPLVPLPRHFYDRDTALVARQLLGAILECRHDGVTARGRIVEVEAYLGPHDPACHAAVGQTARNRHLHGPPGTAYVYRIYGMHWCVNAVTREAGHGSAVLVRALVPLAGLAAMEQRRGTGHASSLANGPGKLCQALGIGGAHDGTCLDRGPLRILRPATGEGATPLPDESIVVTPRIGISKAAEWPLRYALAAEPHCSRTPRSFARYSVHEADEWLRRRALR